MQQFLVVTKAVATLPIAFITQYMQQTVLSRSRVLNANACVPLPLSTLPSLAQPYSPCMQAPRHRVGSASPGGDCLVAPAPHCEHTMHLSWPCSRILTSSIRVIGVEMHGSPACRHLPKMHWIGLGTGLAIQAALPSWAVWPATML